MLAIPLAYAEIGTLTIDDDEIEVFVNGQNMVFDNETRGTFQFLLPECDKTQIISCNAEQKYSKEKLDRMNSELVIFRNKISQMEFKDSSDLRAYTKIKEEKSRLSEENKWLKALLAINMSFMFLIMIWAYFYVKKHQN